jgi:hypothetical protein
MRKWLVRDDVTRKMRRTRYVMTEEFAAARHPGATKVNGSLEVRECAEPVQELAPGAAKMWGPAKTPQ